MQKFFPAKVIHNIFTGRLDSGYESLAGCRWVFAFCNGWYRFGPVVFPFMQPILDVRLLYTTGGGLGLRPRISISGHHVSARVFRDDGHQEICRVWLHHNDGTHNSVVPGTAKAGSRSNHHFDGGNRIFYGRLALRRADD